MGELPFSGGDKPVGACGAQPENLRRECSVPRSSNCRPKEVASHNGTQRLDVGRIENTHQWPVILHLIHCTTFCSWIKEQD